MRLFNAVIDEKFNTKSFFDGRKRVNLICIEYFDDSDRQYYCLGIEYKGSRNFDIPRQLTIEEFKKAKLNKSLEV